MARKTARNSTPEASAGDAYSALAAPWIARLVLAYPQLHEFVQDVDGDAILLRQALKIPALKGRLAKALLRRAAVHCSRIDEWHEQSRASPLLRNIALLAGVAGLSILEQRILALAVLCAYDPALRELAMRLHHCSDSAAYRIVATVLRCRTDDAAKAFMRGSSLIASGLLSLEREPYSLSDKFKLRKGLAYDLLETYANEDDVLSKFFKITGPADLTTEDFPHLSQQISLLIEYLRTSRLERRTGVNVLLYGPTGTGKTQLARALARAVGMKLYEVGSTDADQNSADREERLGSYRLAQRFLERDGDSLVLFDEMQDVFPSDDDPALSRMTRLSKAWVNEQLESNIVPTIWISNDIDSVDKAYLRRFDYSLKMAIPPRRVRRRMIHAMTSDLDVSDCLLEKLADNAALSPAHLQRIMRVAGAVGKQNGVATEQVVEDMVARAMELMQLECRSQRRPTRGDYRLDYLNADCDLQALVRKLRSGQNSCAIALYGPPGTGKTGFARYVANALDRPLHDKRASDLLGAFVGETEASIASMFQEAQRDQAVLFIDEVDSFVGERANMHQSWEVTAVNEMLTQIDGFDGLLLCATNRIEQLDMAAMRRFVIKIKFDYLSGAQRRRLFLETVAVDAQEDVVQDCLMRLERMNNITIGDYEVVRQRAQALGATLGPRELITALQAECALKRDQVRQAIGFID